MGDGLYVPGDFQTPGLRVDQAGADAFQRFLKTELIPRIEARYRAEAATFNGEPIRVTYLTYDEAAERAAEEPFDVVLYAVKYGALPEAIEQSAPLIGPDTAIISVLNGVTSEEVLAERFGWDRVLLCVAQQMDSRKEGATVTAG